MKLTSLDNTQVSPPKLTKEQQKNTEKGRNLLYRLRDVAGSITKGRTCRCGKIPTKKTGLIKVISKDKKHYYFSGLETCGSVWACPVCALKITYKKSEKVSNLLKKIQEGKNHSIGFLTLTTRHHRGETCIQVKDRVLNTWRKITKSRKFRDSLKLFLIEGEIRALEVKFNFRNGWHPHLHILFISKDKEENLMLFGNFLIEIWTNEMGKNATKEAQKFLPVRDFVGIGEYITKWCASDEITKLHAKVSRNDQDNFTPFEMLEFIEFNEFTGNFDRAKILKNKFLEFYQCFKGTKQLTFSKNLIKLYKELEEIKTDEELAQEKQENEVCEFSINKQIFKKIVEYKLQSIILNLTQFSIRDEIIILLEEFGIFAMFEDEILIYRDKKLNSQKIKLNLNYEKI